MTDLNTKLLDPQRLEAQASQTRVLEEASRDRRREAPARLTRRAEFLAAAKGARFHAKGFVLQAAPRMEKVAPRFEKAAPRLEKAAPQQETAARDPLPDENARPRFGVTVTKKLGGAVLRNRIRRRLKEALRLLDPLPARPAHDYVILARPEALGMVFSALQAELARAIAQDPQGKKPRSPRQSRPSPASQSASKPTR